MPNSNFVPEKQCIPCQMIIAGDFKYCPRCKQPVHDYINIPLQQIRTQLQLVDNRS
jgi:hypothetical protein